MFFHCPYCQFKITVKTAPKPGKYQPKCPKCNGKIVLLVPGEDPASWTAERVPGELPASLTDATFVGADASISTSPSGESAAMADRTVSLAPKSAPIGADANATMPSSANVAGYDTNDATQMVTSNPNLESTISHQTRMDEADSEFTVATQHTSKSRPMSSSGEELAEKIGSYEIIKELGRGGMGAVYLARQLSLDRPVALKVMKTEWSQDAIFLARFTREAFAAAQLAHHNVVQIYDIGEDDGTNFFSMEFVEGQSLGDALKKNGPMPVEQALSYILQAARGLNYAHSRGMIHRDIKPDNLMLNVHGLVKVADLGLVKTPTMNEDDDQLERKKTEPEVGSFGSSLRSLPSDITMVNTAMGSPAYMSPEQCRNASAVDARSDIYSLGCTLYALLRGAPPFSGQSVFDVMSKHATEPMPAIPGIPASVGKLIEKMTAKEPGDRFQTTTELIAATEEILKELAGTSNRATEQLQTFELLAKQFQSTPAKLRKKTVVRGAAVVALIAVVVGYLAGGWLAGSSLLLTAVQTLLSYFVVDGILNRTYIWKRTRQYLFGARLNDWLMATAFIILVILVLWFTGLLWVWVGVSIVSVGIAFTAVIVLDRPIKVQQQKVLAGIDQLLRTMRVQGMDEESLRDYVCQNSGPRWEELFEAIFGYDAKIHARAKFAENENFRTTKFGGWRDPIIQFFDRTNAERQKRKDLKHLEKIEAARFRAQGMDQRAAQLQAAANADDFVEKVNRLRQQKTEVVNIKEILTKSEKPSQPSNRPPVNPVKVVDQLLFGWQTRFLLAALLIVLGGLWVKAYRAQIAAATELAKKIDISANNQQDSQEAALKAAGSLRVLLQRGIPIDLPVFGTFRWVDSLNALVAGLILLLSVFTGSRKRQLVMLLAAVVTASLHFVPGIPTLGPIAPHHLGMLAGVSLTILAIVLFKPAEELVEDDEE
ncbi:MAG: serine/threonine-protein kinase [Zavarzinella sp.]